MATRPIDDGVTAPAIRQAMGAASSGRLAEACAIGERALARGGDIVALNAMLGMLRGRAGDPERAARHLHTAHRARPADPVIAHNLAQALLELERYEEIIAALPDATVAADKDGRLRRLRAFAAQMAQNFKLAEADYRAVLDRSPDDWESWNNLGNSLRLDGRSEDSIEPLRRAVALAPDAPPVRLNLATSLLESGDWNGAEEALWQMADDFPDDHVPMRELHALYRRQGRDEDALAAIEEAAKRAPAEVPLLLGHAGHLCHMVNALAAEPIYNRVLDLDSDNAYAHLGLAFCYDLTNRLDELARLAAEAERLGVGENARNFIAALDHRRQKRFAEGVAALEKVPEDLESPRRAHLMGQLLEGVDRFDEAFASYTRMNQLMQEEYPPTESPAAYRNLLQTRFEQMTPEWVSRWREESEPDPRPSPVFLVGFPRSGTTLLDTMLMGHPRIEVLEEEPTLHKAFELFRDYEDMPTADDARIREARDAYFKTAGSLTELKPGNLLVDKNPLAMNAVPFIRRLFPGARIILAVRHPCDCVFSCYVTNFRLNAGMANFVDLKSGAELYDLSFRYLERVQELMPTPTHTVIYERMVADRTSELRQLFEFLELDWHEGVLDHEATAKGRGRIKTASYAQVVEPIYNRSAGRWVNFRKYMEPVLPILRPWIEKFGYEA
jgi:tetratricopeptide (TPR) repeat protein